VDRENLGATLRVGGVYLNLSIESPRAKKSGVKDVRTVRRGDHDDVLPWLEAIHLDEELIQCLFALVVATAHSGATVSTNGVDFVDENDGGRVLFGDVEEVTNTAGTDADKHFDEVRAGNRIERYRCLTRDGASKQSFTRSRRPVQQNALRDSCPDFFELFGVLKELFDLVKLFDCFVCTGDIGERHLR
jgi:hypothetical protein